jgi:hypothetical protein
MYIPIIKTLKNLLKNKAVLREVMNGHMEETDMLLGDYCDGEKHKSHSVYMVDHSHLQLGIYFDELELCNPLASRRTKLKIGAFYYTLGNLHPKLRQQTSNIQLLALVKSSLIKKHAMYVILKHVLKDFKILEQGVNFYQINRPLKACVTVFSADNLGSQEIGAWF